MEKYYLHLGGEQKGPFTLGQLQDMWRAGSINLDTQFWTKGGGEWKAMEAILDLLEPPVLAAPSLSSAPPPAVPPASPSPKPSVSHANAPATQTKTPGPVGASEVKQGAAIGGWVCFGLGVLFMYFSLWSFLLYTPLFLVAFILAIVALAQKRIGSGISLLLSCLIVPAVLWIYLGATRTAKTIENATRAMTNDGEASRTSATQTTVSPKSAPPPVLQFTMQNRLAVPGIPKAASGQEYVRTEQSATFDARKTPAEEPEPKANPSSSQAVSNGSPIPPMATGSDGGQTSSSKPELVDNIKRLLAADISGRDARSISMQLRVNLGSDAGSLHPCGFSQSGDLFAYLVLADSTTILKVREVDTLAVRHSIRLPSTPEIVMWSPDDQSMFLTDSRGCHILRLQDGRQTHLAIQGDFGGSQFFWPSANEIIVTLDTDKMATLNLNTLNVVWKNVDGAQKDQLRQQLRPRNTHRLCALAVNELPTFEKEILLKNRDGSHATSVLSGPNLNMVARPDLHIAFLMQGRPRDAGELIALYFGPSNPSVTQQAMEAPKPAQSGSKTDGGVQGMPGERYPRTRIVVLSAEEVEGMNADALRYAINEMYARHGAEFKNAELKATFRKLPWYRPIINRGYDEAELLFSETEATNVKMLGLRRDEIKGKPGVAPGAYKELAWQRPGTKEKAAVDQANAELDRVYNEIMGRLRPQLQKALREEELTWIKWRDEEIARLVGPPRGGSGYRMDSLEALLALVQKRTAELKSNWK